MVERAVSRLRLGVNNNFWRCKRSQLSIQQMSFMLLAVILFFILAGLFFLSVKSGSLKKDVELMEKDKALLNAGFLAGSAEFSCGDDCIDTDRLMVLKNSAIYKKFWPFSIQVRKIYPKQDKEIKCSVGNYPNCNFYDVYERNLEGEKKVYNFVTLCRREKSESGEYRKCELGKLIIAYQTN